MADNLMSLFCLVDREPTSHAFSIKVPSNDTVDDLKDLIKTKKSNDFSDIDADKLTLWHVSIPITDDEIPIVLDHVTSKKKLGPATRLSNIFPKELPEETVHIIVQRPPQPRSPKEIKERDTEKDWNEIFIAIETEFFASGSDKVTNLYQFVVGPATVPTTRGTLGGLPLIPTRVGMKEGRPSLLFLNLPESSAPLDRLSTAAKALAKIDGQAVPLVPFFGVSGCGKTRTAIEMLSKRWGFYFSASETDLGSSDLGRLLRSIAYKKRHSTDDHTEVQILALALVLSRIMSLEHCLDVAQREGTIFTCKHWMLLQVGFHTMGIPDLFASLSGSIAYTIRHHSMDILTVAEIVRNRFWKLQQRLKDGTALPPKLLLVIDEAQNLNVEEYGVFDSQVLEDSATSSDDLSRPILSPLMHGLYQIAHDPNLFSVIPCGTGLSLFDMNWLEDSAPAAKGHGKARFTDFRGWESLEQVRDYRNGVRDSLPNHEARTIFDYQVPDASVPMLFATLRGRFRPIVSAIERMVKSDSGETNWELAIKETVNNLTLPEVPEKGNVCHDIQKMIAKVAEFPSRYEKYQDIRATLKTFVVQHYLFGRPLLLNKEEAPLVEASVGRILNFGAKKQTVLDEPFVLLAAKNYFQQYDTHFHSILCGWFSTSTKPSVHGHTWESAMLPSLVNAFDGKVLSKTPLVPEGKSHDSILDSEAKIAGYEGHTTLGINYVCMPSLDTFLTAHVHDNSLCDGKLLAPFYYPAERKSGPDIVFVLRFGDLGCCPVFVQSKLRMKMPGSETRDAFSTVKSDAVEGLLEETMLEEYCTVSPKRFFGVVVAYPAELAGSEGLFPTIRRSARILSAQGGDKPECISLRIDSTNIHKLFLRKHMEALAYLKTLEDNCNSGSSQSGSSQSGDDEPAAKQRRLDVDNRMELD